MKFATAYWPEAPKTQDAKKIAVVFAFLLVMMTIAQLFSFEKFIELLESFSLPGDATGRVIAATLVTAGLFALPFLLRMKLSIAMRWLSMVAGWIVVATWLFLTVWVNVASSGVANIGFLGASVTIIPGWWAVSVIVGLGLLATWASWGLWPGKRRSVVHKKVSLERRPKK